MIQILPQATTKYSLDYYATDPIFSAPVGELRNEAKSIAAKLRGRTIWMVNSTASGGGVAEMLPSVIALMNNLGLRFRWAVIQSDRQEFFSLTKRIHNLIHGDTASGADLGPEDAKLYETVNLENAASFKKELKPEDILVVHDPQPLPLGQILTRELGITAVWRCHIGLDRRLEATKTAWRFLKPYLDGYRHTIFSAPEYIPDYCADRSTIIHPAIDPLSHKNQELSVTKLTGILCNSGLLTPYEPVVTPNFRNRVTMLTENGSYVVPNHLGLLFRPIVLQVSRWDRLKGWSSLLEGFVRLKSSAVVNNGENKIQRKRKRLELARLVLAGPDPGAVADDPEGEEVLQQMQRRYASLDPKLRRDIAIILLPMKSHKENALIVNAMQRCASIIVQNSVQEGFGLTVTEAMWKRKAVLGTTACGIRRQVRDGIDGSLVSDPENPDEIADKLGLLLNNSLRRYNMGRSGQRRVYDHFLIFRQMSSYIKLLGKIL
ncbi:MAG: glycosyltransferase [Syntrophaceae bacterium]|nr:glycosyltransferase [Syntrophaceae bacterium]